MIEALRRVWGKVRRTPRLPERSRTAGEVVVIPQPYRVAWSTSSDFTSWLPSPDTGSMAIPPEPPRPSWAAYDKLMASHSAYPGWTFCRFGVRGPRSDDHSEVQGIVCAPFGAWWAPFLCVEQTLGHRISRGLACIEHTRTGMAIGVFGDMDVAVAAAEIAMRMHDWTAFDVERAQSLHLIHRVRSAWDAAGIVQSDYAGYPTVNGEVPQGQGPVAIFVKNPMADQQRPEKLS